MEEKDTIGKPLLDELMGFVGELELLTMPSRNGSLIKLMESINPEKIRKVDDTGKSLGERYSDEISTPTGDVARKISSLIEEGAPKGDLYPILHDFDKVLHNIERYLDALYGFIEDRSLSGLTAIDCLKPDQMQGYCDFAGNYNDFIRSYRRYRLKLHQEYSTTLPERSLMKLICSLRYPPEE